MLARAAFCFALLGPALNVMALTPGLLIDCALFPIFALSPPVSKVGSLDLFVSNLWRRLCALQDGAIAASVYSVALPEDEASKGWAWHARVLTSALTEAYSRDHRLHVDFKHAPTWKQPGSTCDDGKQCLFDGSGFSLAASSDHQLWDADRVRVHHLQGAGLLWLRRRTMSITGCDLAAAFVTALLRPTEQLQHFVDSAAATLASTGMPAVVFNADSIHVTVEQGAASLEDAGNTTVWVIGGSHDQAVSALRLKQPNAYIRLLPMPDSLSEDASTALKAAVISMASHYIGDLDELWVKAGLLWRLGRHHAFPQLTTGSSHWKDDYGFASCTAEEFRVHVKSQSGESLRELLALPPEVQLPSADYMSTRSGWSGRNSDPKLCANISIPDADAAIGVDELLERGRAVSFGCESGGCPKVLPLALEERGAYAFQGSFSEKQRDNEYSGAADHQRCGFMAPSGFDVIRDFVGFRKCKVVVVNLIARGRDVLLNVQNVAPHNLVDERVCFISIMDVNGLITHELEPPPDGGLMKYGHWTVVALLNSPWEGSTDFPWLRGARDANVMRHLRFRVFPNAESSMWIDGKHQLATDPCTLFDQLLNQNGKAMAAFQHENQRCVFKEHDVIKGLGWTAAIPGYRDQITQLSERYHREGMPSEADGHPQGAYDLAVIVSRHVDVANVASCLAYTEIESFTSRNQLHYPYTVWRAGLKPFLYEAPNCATWIYTRHVGHWSDHGGKF